MQSTILRKSSRFLAGLAMVLVIQSAWALDLQSAKQEGLVGEAKNGMLAAVNDSPSQEVRDLVATVNGKRQARFKKTAAKTGATLKQVQHRFYELAVQKTKSGHYYQDANGRWQKK